MKELLVGILGVLLASAPEILVRIAAYIDKKNKEKKDKDKDKL